MYMYSIFTLTPSIATKMLGDKIIVKFGDEKNLISAIKSGKTDFLERDYDLRIDMSGQLVKNFSLAKAVVQADTPVKAYLSYENPSAVKEHYPEIYKQYKDVIPAKLKAAMQGKSHAPFEIDITPEIASALILLNKTNRTIKTKPFEEHCRALKAGNWKGANASMITISKDGVLTNGQHRLLACILTNLPMNDMVIQGCVEADEDMDTGAKRTPRDNIKSKYGKDGRGIDITNLLYRIVVNENLNPVSSVAVPLFFRYENLLNDVPVFRAGSVDVRVNAPYKTAFLILLESGKYPKEQLIKVHKLLNNGSLTGAAYDQELINLKKRMNEKKGEFSTVGVSSAENQKLIVYCMLATLVPVLKGEKRWKFTGKKGTGITNVREFIMNSCGKEVLQIIEENSK